MAHDCIVSMCTYRDGLAAITDRGALFTITPDEFGAITIQFVQHLPFVPRPLGPIDALSLLEEELREYRARDEAFRAEVTRVLALPWYRFLWDARLRFWPWKG